MNNQENSQIFKPTSETQVCEMVKWVLANNESIDVFGTHTRKNVGKPMDTTCGLDMSGLKGVQLYEPEELVLSAGAGSSLAEIEKLLKDNNQQFEFEPPNFSHLLGNTSSGTLGGMVACGFAGPRRVKAGSVRDHVLGVRTVSGRGELFKSGGRVVKNVTGYDLPKILTSSWGTLGAMTQITFKVLPKPETENTLILLGLDSTSANRAMTMALGSVVDVSGAALLPDGRTALRLEGIKPSVKSRVETLKKILVEFGDIDVLQKTQSSKLWADVRDVKALSSNDESAIWRISVPPAAGAKYLELIEQQLDVTAVMDWGGGLIWLEIHDQKTACAAQVRSAVAKTGGHATLFRAPEKSRAGSAVFQPQPDALAALTARVKTVFDPKNILNPNRMYEAQG